MNGSGLGGMRWMARLGRADGQVGIEMYEADQKPIEV